MAHGDFVTRAAIDSDGDWVPLPSSGDHRRPGAPPPDEPDEPAVDAATPPPAARPPAGREADALVGQRVFGWTVEGRNGQPYRVSVAPTPPAAPPAAPPGGAAWTSRSLVPAFSTDARAALQVVAYMAQLAGPASRQSVELVQDAAGRWHGRFVRRGRASPRFVDAATLPLAICRAALTAAAFFPDQNEQRDRD